MRILGKFQVLAVILAVPMFCLGQKSTGAASDKKKSQPAATVPNEAAKMSTTKPQIGKNLANTVVDNTTDITDHVPCFFTLKELMALRPVPGVPRLTEFDQSRVLTGLAEAVEAAGDSELTRAQKAKFMSILAGDLDGKLIGKTPGEALATVMDILYQITVKNADLYTAASDPGSIRQATINRAKKYGGDTFASAVQKKLDSQTNWFKQKDPGATLDQLSELVGAVPSELSAGKPAPDDTKAAATKTQEDLSDAGSGQTISSVVESARSSINKFSRPTDIGCAYEILSWDESKLLFGRSVANEFIAIQVTVRNLNAKEEFLVHNAMLSVDTDIHGAMGQYFQGVDKTGVEAYNNAGESLTRRGIIGNSIIAATTLLSALQPIVNVGNFSNAVAAFNGGVPQGWKVLSPDHQKEQLLLIANSGFSATGNSKTVVSKSGAATFYLWFPAKPFLQGWWLQPCAQEIAAVKDSDDSGGAEPRPEIGVDLQRARTECQGIKAATWKAIPYQHWSSISDQLFRDLSLAVVAGIHVREDSKNQGTVTDLKCTKDAEGRLDISKPTSTGTFVCDVTGENLDKVTKLRLENAGNLVDPARPDGVVSEVSSDNASAKVTFNASDLLALTGDSYNVFAVAKDSTETATGQKIDLDRTTVKIDKVDPASLDLGKQPWAKLTLSGHNLDKLKNVGLSTGSGTDCKKAPVSSSSSITGAVLDVNSAGLTQGTWAIYVEDCTGLNTNQALTVTGATAANQVPTKPAVVSH